MSISYLYLALAIIAEVAATSALKASEEFTRLIPSLIVIIGYSLAFYFMTLTLRTIPIGVTYAIWSGVGIILVSLVGIVLYKQSLDTPALIGMGLIIAGVIVIHLYSKAMMH